VKLAKAKVRQRRNAVFVAINFWDVVCLPPIAAIFDFGVVAISLKADPEARKQTGMESQSFFGSR
jgi:hypothetical protein